VFAATHLALGKTYALKILHEVYGRDSEIIDRFMREARAATQTGHPNIIDVVDIGTMEEGDLYFVMELLEGTDLGTVIRQSGPLAIRRAVHISRQICRAVTAAHDAGIIHRDHKSENVVLTVKGGDPDFVKVLDFGICKQIDSVSSAQTTPGMVMGSPDYMAPEQAAGAPADTKSDIYALGTILFEMLTGHLPFTGRNAIDVLMKKGGGPAPRVSELRPEVPPPLTEVVARCLERELDARPESMRALEYELTRALEGRASAVAAVMGLQLDAEAAASASGSGPKVAAVGGPASEASTAGGEAGRGVDRGGRDTQGMQGTEKIVTVHDQAVAAGERSRAAKAEPLRSRRTLWIGVGVVAAIAVVVALAFSSGVFDEPEQAAASEQRPPEGGGPEIAPQPSSAGLDGSVIEEPNADGPGESETGEVMPLAKDATSIVVRAERALAEERWREPLDESLAVELNNLGIVDPGHEAIARLRSEAALVLGPRAKTASKREDWATAVTAYRDLLAVWPEHEVAREQVIEALRELGQVQRKASDFAGLLATADELLNREPNLFIALKYRAEALEGLERWEEAVPAYRAAMRVRASNKDVKTGYWRARQKLKQQSGG
jgi:tetratricopeptide (TPR) repeat protein